MVPYAELADLEARFPRDLTGDESERAETLLGDASFWLGVRVPGLDEAIAGGNEQAATAAKLLTVAMVSRALQEMTIPDPNVESESVGPFSVKYRTPQWDRYLTDCEWSDIADLLRVNRADAVSMRSRGL